MTIQIFCNSTFYCDYTTCIFAQCIKIVRWCTLFYPGDLTIYKLKPNNHMKSLSRLCQGMRHGRRQARGTYHFISRLLFLLFNIMCYRATVQAGHIKQSRAWLYHEKSPPNTTSLQTSQIASERMRLFPLAIVFFYSFRLIEVRKENDTHETTWINNARSFGVITRFKSHVRGRIIWTFLCTSGTKSHSRSAKFKYTHIKQSSKWR